jgi:benzoyl-CoA 2,3-dioxygenase component B
MFVGETGLLRIVQRTCELMKRNKNEDARAEGGVDLPTMQKYLNLWYSVSLDLFGGEISSNAASFFASSVKGRAKEESYEDHRAIDGAYALDVPVVGAGGAVSGWRREEVPLRNAMNEVLRDEYVSDSQRGIDKMNRVIEEAGVPFRLRLPSRRFHRSSGIYAGLHFDVDGNPLSKEAWERRRDAWLPTASDEAYVRSLMEKPVFDPKQMANWIAAPAKGLKGKPVDFEYVRRSG